MSKARVKASKGTATASKAKKPKIASSALLKLVERLIAKATSAPAKTHLQALSEDKLFEVFALAKFLGVYKRVSNGGSVIHVPPAVKGAKSSNVVVAGGPASRNRKRFSHFELIDGSSRAIAEAWVSLEVHTLSWDVGGRVTPVPLAARHELDVAIVDPGMTSYPNHDEIQVAVSCKNQSSTPKEQVREALGLRRETAYLDSNQWSRAPWLKAHVPSFPASPLFLISSDVGVKKYRSPVDQLGVYVKYMHYPTYI